MTEKPNVLVLGGCGFIGRHLVSYLVNNDLAHKIRVADKCPPQLAWLNKEHQVIYDNVEFTQADLVNEAHVERAFATSGFHFHFVINLAAETRFGQTEQVYNDHVYKLSMNCARKAAELGVGRFVEMSTAQVYQSDKKASSEEGKTAPWTSLAVYKMKVEQELAEIPGLNYAIVRPSTVYGVGDRQGLMPRLIIGAVYKHLREKMKLLWTKDLKMNTVHVSDVVVALWCVCYASPDLNGEVYNLADLSDSTQGSISELVCQIFHINYDFFGSVMSKMAKLNMKAVVEESNEKHLAPWSEACRRDGIENTPLSPYLDKELLYNNHLHVDGRKIESLGFNYTHPHVTVDQLNCVVEDYVALGVFPPSLLQI